MAVAAAGLPARAEAMAPDEAEENAVLAAPAGCRRNQAEGGCSASL